MKKTVVFLTALLLLSNVAFAEWEEGLSSAKPFSYVEECDLAAHVGYMMSMPEHNTKTPCGVDLLTLYLPRTDLTAMEGMLTVTSGPMALAVSDLSVAEILPMTDEELGYYGWGEGVAVRMRLSDALPPDTLCAVNIPEGAFHCDGLEKPSGRLNGNAMWSFTTESFGIANLTDSFAQGASPRVGDTTTMDIVMGDAREAVVEIFTPETLSCDCEAFDADGKLTLTYTGKGDAEYSIYFYTEIAGDAHGLTARTTVK